MILETRLLHRILDGLWVAIRGKLLGQMFPNIANIITTSIFDVVNHVLYGTLEDFRLPARCFANALVIAQSPVAGAPGDLESIEDLIVGEAVAEAILDEFHDFMVRSNPSTRCFFLLQGRLIPGYNQK